MKKYLLSAALLLAVGGGCVATDTSVTPVDEQSEEFNFELMEGEAGGRVADPVAFPSGTFEMYRGYGYALPIDEYFEIEQTGDDLRIQNFVGQDDPHFTYSAEAFFIEIASSPVKNFAFESDYARVAEVELAGEMISKGTERVMGGDSWPGHGYYNEDKNVYIRISYLYPEGAEIAEAILSHLSWE